MVKRDMAQDSRAVGLFAQMCILHLPIPIRCPVIVDHIWLSVCRRSLVAPSSFLQFKPSLLRLSTRSTDLD